jgi:hypothetical protein
VDQPANNRSASRHVTNSSSLLFHRAGFWSGGPRQGTMPKSHGA